MDIVIIGLLLGGTYALMAMGLQLQYGVARIMNLANGEILIAGAFSTFWFYAGTHLSPLLALFLVVPAAFVLNWAIYRVLILPLVRRAKSQGKLEVDSILATFGLSFISVGIMLAIFGGEYLDYSYLSQPIFIFGERYGLNRVVAFIASAALCLGLYVWLHKTRAGLTLRAVAVNPAPYPGVAAGKSLYPNGAGCHLSLQRPLIRRVRQNRLDRCRLPWPAAAGRLPPAPSRSRRVTWLTCPWPSAAPWWPGSASRRSGPASCPGTSSAGTPTSRRR